MNNEALNDKKDKFLAEFPNYGYSSSKLGFIDRSISVETSTLFLKLQMTNGFYLFYRPFSTTLRIILLLIIYNAYI
jgi:hypothetical protein